MAIFKESKPKSSILVTLTLILLAIGVIPLLISNWRIIAANRDALESSLQESFAPIVSTIATQISDFVNAYRSQMVDYAPRALTNLRNSKGSASGSRLS